MPSTPTKAARPRDSLGKRTHDETITPRKAPLRSGEVESSTSGAESDDEDDVPLSVTRIHNAAKVSVISTGLGTPTARRQVVNKIEGPGTIHQPRPNVRARETLASRLAAAASKPSRSSTPSAHVTPTTSRIQPPRVSLNGSPAIRSPAPRMSINDTVDNSDKVVVCVRVKPTASVFAVKAYEFSATSLSLSDQHPNVLRRGGKAGREAEYVYHFDTLIQYPTRTPELYSEKVAPLVQKTMNGFNSTVFAYGQTGSGKSHTMSGTANELGIIPCAVDGIFDAITAETERAFLLRVSYIEIYNESLRDLLNAHDESPTIRSAKGKVIVDPLIEEIVSTPQDVVDLLEKGNRNRKTGATDWNERSSRSHAVFTITVESRPREGDSDEVRVSKLTLIDLAGSEKAVSDVERRGEGRHINQSLLALREVVHKLTEKGKRGHIPYRNSKLTHLLENVLGGDSNICVICTMSAEDAHTAETLETLKFASRCSQVETKAQKNILLSSDRAVIRAKDLEIADLKRQLEEIGRQRQPLPTVTESDGLVTELAEMEARKTRLSSQIAKLNAEILTSEFAGQAALGKGRRPRISDFTSVTSASAANMGGGGLATPTKATPKERRVVSSIHRVGGETPADAHSRIMDAMDNNRGYNDDLVLTALRGQLTSKEAELEKAKSSLASLQTTHHAKLRDTQVELQSTRRAHALAVEEKTARIEALEAAVLDLRKSREELVIEDLQRIDEVEAKLDAVTKDRDTAKNDLEELRSKHSDEISNVKKAIRTLRGEVDQHAERASGLETARNDLKSSLEVKEKELDAARVSLQSAQRDAEKAVSDLASFQQAAMGRESEVVAGLRSELEKERQARETADAKGAEALANLQQTESKSADVRAQLEKVIQEKQKATEELTEEREARKKDVEGLLRTNKQLEMDLDTANKSAGEARGLHEASVKDGDELKTEVSRLQAALQAMSEKFAALEKEKAAGESRLAEETTSRVATEKRLAEQESTSKNHTEQLSKQISTLTSLSDNHKRDLETVRGDLSSKTAEHADAITSLDQLRRQLAEKTTDHDSATREIQALRAGADAAQSVHAELESLRALLDSEKKDRATLEATHASSVADNKKLTAQLVEVKTCHDAKNAAHEQATRLLEESKARATELQGIVDGERKARDEMIAERDKSNAAAQSAIATLEKERIARDEDQKTLAKLRSDLDSSVQFNAHHDQTVNSLRAELAKEKELRVTAENAAKASVSSSAKQLMDSGAELTSVKFELEKVAAALEEEQVKAGDKARHIEQTATRITALERELELSHSELSAMRVRADRLAKELVSASSRAAQSSSPQRGALSSKSMPNLLSTVAMEALRGAGSMASNSRTPDIAGWRRSHETEEIERLDKVVEAQKSIIEEQRLKIKHWADELEKQREIVRLLTQESAVGSASPDKDLPMTAIPIASPGLATPPRKQAYQSHPRGSPSSNGTGTPVGQLDPARLTRWMQPQSEPISPRRSEKNRPANMSSTFTARNLALPSAPSPLPMHTGQFSNALRKARRITIDRDMGRLQEFSKVNHVKGVFDSPERPEPGSPSKSAGSAYTKVDPPRRRAM